MSFESLIALSRSFLIIGFIMLIITIRLYFRLDIYKAIHILTGRKLKVPVQTTTVEQKKTSEKLSKENIIEEIQDKTIPLQITMSEIEDNDKTIALGTFKIKYDVVYIHTLERI